MVSRLCCNHRLALQGNYSLLTYLIKLVSFFKSWLNRLPVGNAGPCQSDEVVIRYWRVQQWVMWLLFFVSPLLYFLWKASLLPVLIHSLLTLIAAGEPLAYKKLTLFNGMKLFGLHAEQALDFSLRVMQTLLLRCDVGHHPQGLDCPPSWVRVGGRCIWTTTLPCRSRLKWDHHSEVSSGAL